MWGDGIRGVVVVMFLVEWCRGGGSSGRVCGVIVLWGGSCGGVCRMVVVVVIMFVEW